MKICMGKANYAEYWRKDVQENIRYEKSVPSGMNFIGRFRVIQSDKNLHKTGKIFGCSIVYVTFFKVCNSIINQC